MWGLPLLILLSGGGLFFTFYCRLIPFYHIRHGFNILIGKYDNSNDPGQISHFQALSSALASTVGMGNISGVAVAIHMGGPGAIFWMWISAILGMATKFFTCTLAILYRGKDEDGEVQGGPMYVIKEGICKIDKDGWILNKSSYPVLGKFLANLFAIAGLFGCFSLFQANQLTQIIQNQIFVPFNLFSQNTMIGQLVIGILLAGIISAVIFGGIRRIGQVASRLVPAMVLLYMLCGFIILIGNITKLDDIFLLIIHDAFTGHAVAGGAAFTVFRIGFRRAAFSNEAGIGTESMAHGAAITNEPVREGLVAMLGPMIDTLIVCSITGFIILTSGIWDAKFQTTEEIELTSEATTIIDIGNIHEFNQPNKNWIGLEFYVPTNKKNEGGFIVVDSLYSNSSIYCHFKSEPSKTIIIKKGNWFKLKAEGIILTTMSFNKEIGSFGGIILMIIVIIFGITTIIGYSYYGSKCTAFLFGNKWKQYYRVIYVLSLIPAAIISMDIIINYVDGMFAMMAIPTMISTILLAPKVMTATRDYFSRLDGKKAI
jgi:AGCS family alanine or glycine:cation symporter